MQAIGLMSGTSLDGVDAAWVETDGVTVARQGPALTLAYDDGLRADLRRLLDLAPSLDAADPWLAGVVTRLTARHVEAVAALALEMAGETAEVIGFHGQTILHDPARHRTWQVGDAAALARATGTPVVHDFRSADVAAGGQGAPFAPAFHAALAHGMTPPWAVLNIGGVANLTFLGSNGSLLACDTGPGNGPLDDWAMRCTGLPCDRDGALAATGTVDRAVLDRLMADPFFARAAPKSLDRLAFAQALAGCGLSGLTPADGAATLVAFTVEAVARTQLPEPPGRWLVTGGGRHNPVMMAGLASRLGASVDAVEAVGWDGDAMEARCFAYLAVRSVNGLPLSFPGTTGVARAMTGGRLVPAPS